MRDAILPAMAAFIATSTFAFAEADNSVRSVKNHNTQTLSQTLETKVKPVEKITTAK